MCPLSPSWLAGRTSIEIEDDTPCMQCGYNLVGLRSDERCPECGTPITDVTLYGAPSVNDRPGKVLRNSGSLLEAPRPYAEAFCTSCSALGIGGLLTLVLLLASIRDPVFALMAILPAGMYFVGVMGVTKSRQVGTRAEIDTVGEWRSLRTTARWTQ
ncbi:MAG: hypothetical protein KDA28_15100, partial [Phycisphaerales bacterium]|nr:hypothetical protein [Phycisphaerales bacterium]